MRGRQACRRPHHTTRWHALLCYCRCCSMPSAQRGEGDAVELKLGRSPQTQTSDLRPMTALQSSVRGSPSTSYVTTHQNHASMVIRDCASSSLCVIHRARRVHLGTAPLAALRGVSHRRLELGHVTRACTAYKQERTDRDQSEAEE